jgi:hypothetical protein
MRIELPKTSGRAGRRRGMGKEGHAANHSETPCDAATAAPDDVGEDLERIVGVQVVARVQLVEDAVGGGERTDVGAIDVDLQLPALTARTTRTPAASRSSR